MGYGTVGAGVFKVLTMNREVITGRVGEEIRVKYVLDLREFPGDPVMEVLTHDFNDILNDPEVKIVVETMGGLRPSYEFTRKALLAGKSVCTSNKELVAEHGVELREIAKEKNVNYLFEASCGGGIPIIHVLDSALTADEIDGVAGILNGTTNYILTQMMDDGQEVADALKDAQDLGYAERHPEADIEGWDACRKIAILSSLAYGKHISYKNVYTEGITNIDAVDMSYAKALKMKIRLLAASGRTDAGVHARRQVCSFRADTDWDAGFMLTKLRQYLPEDIGAVSLEEAAPRFHARLNCREKTYLYRVWNSETPNVFERRFLCPYPAPLDLDEMRRAAKQLLGD